MTGRTVFTIDELAVILDMNVDEIGGYSASYRRR